MSAPSNVAVPIAPAEGAYRLVASDGGVFVFGDLGFRGSMGGTLLNRPVGMANTPLRDGYWLVASDGGIFAFGDATFHGSTGSIPLNRPIVGMERTATGNGYWLVASDGGIFAFGDATFHGSTGGAPPPEAILGMERRPGTDWLVDDRGEIYAFAAPWLGSTGHVCVCVGLAGMATTASGNGYWLAGRDGGIFAFGDASFYGSTGGTPLTARIVGVAPQMAGTRPLGALRRLSLLEPCVPSCTAGARCLILHCPRTPSFAPVEQCPVSAPPARSETTTPGGTW